MVGVTMNFRWAFLWCLALFGMDDSVARFGGNVVRGRRAAGCDDDRAVDRLAPVRWGVLCLGATTRRDLHDHLSSGVSPR